MMIEPTVAVLIPCYNEEAAISKVVKDFLAAVPNATVFVYDNNSTDRTVEIATAAGAVVRVERLQGKGNVVRRMFADVEADVFVLVDGDDTYDATSAPKLIQKLLRESLDMVNAVRVESSAAAYRHGHRFGNRLLTGFVAWIFGSRSSDMLSGYRVFSRRFVKSFPALATGFEIETELTVHALELGLPIAEVPTPYRERPPGSASKLRTYRDGMRIANTIVNLIKEEKPLTFFTLVFAVLAATSVGLGVPIIITFMETGLVPALPTAILATGLMSIAFLSLACGLILDTVTRGRKELKRLAYLSIPIRFSKGVAGTLSEPQRVAHR
jgi:glycosyltransferase involved in cell wall biosynthesis